ncbi:hypothetical protein D3260_07215 [Salinisphaera sp. Q1T1-3]|nr:hypothetical protein D3260_07215 [Salinisphaera sp. Q1T1-3]
MPASICDRSALVGPVAAGQVATAPPPRIFESADKRQPARVIDCRCPSIGIGLSLFDRVCGLFF